ncbi:IS200/IS605 family transposase, partial [Staphylococcus pseudintermedius]|uniref:IS200/IS605 family transposase n=6 Tax=Staphylococcus pseudintermedius TaxID=283734 RepID=UPI002162E23F
TAKKRHFQTAIKQHFQTAIKQHFQTAIDTCKDHIHMLVSIPPKLSVSQLVGYLKGKSSLMIFDRHVHLKYRYGDRKFWCKGFYVDTVGRNRKVIEEYIRNQLQEDIVAEKRTMMEYIDSFTGEENKRLRKK